MTAQTILTVDDSRTMRDMLMLTLTEAGYRVVQAVDGEHGLDVLGAEAPTVIITDINMPRLDGFGFIERVRADPRFLGIPILVLTTESSPEKKSCVARRRHRLDRQAFRLGQARRCRSAGRVLIFLGNCQWIRWPPFETPSFRNAASSWPKSRRGSRR